MVLLFLCRVARQCWMRAIATDIVRSVILTQEITDKLIEMPCG